MRQQSRDHWKWFNLWEMQHFKYEVLNTSYIQSIWATTAMLKLSLVASLIMAVDVVSSSRECIYICASIKCRLAIFSLAHF